jgi:hypothetical protein
MQRKTIVLKIIYLIILLLALGASGYFYYQYSLISNNKSENEIKQLIANVGKYIELPNETPTVATVSDQSKLKNEPFFQRSKNGDKVLIFEKFGRVILYRPSINKVIDMTVLQSNNQSSPLAVPTRQPITVTFYNGTNTTGLTIKFEESLKNKFSEIDIVKKEQAKRNDYGKTLVIDISKKYPDMVKLLASELSAEVSSIPEGETQPSSDILIIFGKDKE